jgi:hypothetical protein
LPADDKNSSELANLDTSPKIAATAESSEVCDQLHQVTA